MSKEELCWECKEYISNKYGPMAYYPPFQHCHHEPKEKPRCSCYEFNPSSKTCMVYYKVGSGSLELNYCPKCGRKL